MLPAGETTLTFTYVGMKQQKMRMSTGKKNVIRLQADANAIGETVITGIYSRKKESFTGSAASYRKEELKAIGNQNVLQSLSALDPSFVIMENNLAGSDPNAKLNSTSTVLQVLMVFQISTATIRTSRSSFLMVSRPHSSASPI